MQVQYSQLLRLVNARIARFSFFVSNTGIRYAPSLSSSYRNAHDNYNVPNFHSSSEESGASVAMPVVLVGGQAKSLPEAGVLSARGGCGSGLGGESLESCELDSVGLNAGSHESDADSERIPSWAVLLALHSMLQSTASRCPLLTVVRLPASASWPSNLPNVSPTNRSGKSMFAMHEASLFCGPVVPPSCVQRSSPQPRLLSCLV